MAAGRGRVVCAVVGVVALALAVAASTQAAPQSTAALPKSCPSASVVSSALGEGDGTGRDPQHVFHDVRVWQQCARAQGHIPEDTAATFAAGERQQQPLSRWPR